MPPCEHFLRGAGGEKLVVCQHFHMVACIFLRHIMLEDVEQVLLFLQAPPDTVPRNLGVNRGVFVHSYTTNSECFFGAG